MTILEAVKRCCACGETKPATAFNRRHDRGLHKVQSKCRDCSNAYNREWTKSESFKAGQKARRYRLKWRYGATLEQYDTLLQAQGGSCAVCKGLSSKGSKLAVDHCHSTGAVRGLLCDNCNRAIGLLGDSADVLRRAADYLELKRD